MHFSASCSAIVALVLPLISQVSAAGQLGFALGVKHADGSCKYQADYEADFDAIGTAGSSIVRIYSAADCDVTRQILPAAKNKGFKVVLGIWPDTDDSYNAGKAAILESAVGYPDQVYAITVGSEALYRGTFTADQLISKIADMRQAAPQFRYGTADSWNMFIQDNGLSLVPVADILLVNAFAYWQGAAISNAVNVFNDDINQAFDRIKSVAGDKQIELWVGETGWPTEGTTYQAAVPSLESAEFFYHNGVCSRLSDGTNVFYFEAFDEPWKPDSIGDDGSAADEKHWGAMTSDRVAKFSLQC
ncbi:unnamed protein product [Clonostachys byssicola]|uniref:glucan 1,3-beta-glucosidase n=1 Tax=Clonostachys byssicola TaxID=160290 RepID=A0A9N9ULQ8_9HYPO|nr:unnamed protein product [Clonostachys byssicola]